jgi:hypothetical protein
MIKVEGHQNLYRDENSGAIINYDSSEYEDYLRNISQKESEKNQLDTMRKEIDELKSLLKEITNGSR